MEYKVMKEYQVIEYKGLTVDTELEDKVIDYAYDCLRKGYRQLADHLDDMLELNFRLKYVRK